MCTDAAQAASRVVSLNPCLDTVLVHIAARDQIAGLSHYARQPGASTITDVALTLPYTYETAEEVIALNPDLVLTSRHSSLATRNALARLSIRAELFDVPESVEASIAQIRRIAALIDRVQAGEEMIAGIEAALDAAQPPHGTPPITALVFQRNGFAAGKGTLVDELLSLTGFVNVAGHYGVGHGDFGKWGIVPLEDVIFNPPQVLLAGEPSPGTPIWADRVLMHPALKRISHRMVRAAFPDELLYCGGPVLIQSTAALVKARNQVLGVAP
ncbi:MAG: ABC transporter substrate-binding protein [Rhodospirillaceae bacterium]|nr:ABC transporter substrate-binding protein [Rhodospirillaceae bacterium]